MDEREKRDVREWSQTSDTRRRRPENNARKPVTVRDKADKECRKRDLDGIEDLRDKAAEQGEEGGMPLYGGFCFLC